MSKSKSYCAVDGCSNRSEKLGLFRFFKLPADAERRTKWLQKIGRNDLLQRKDLKPQSYCVCSAHFKESCLITKLYLTPDAVPSLLLPGSANEHEDEAPSPSAEIEEKLGDESQNTLLKLAGWQNKIQDLNIAERNGFALNLYFANPNTYKLLKPLFKLPNVSALRKPSVKVPLKHDERVMEYLALKMKSLPEQAKHCTMCLGEMKLKPHLYYDTKGDSLIGFHSINGHVTNKMATHAYVIMLQGIFHKWRQPLSYAFLPDLEHLEDIGSWVDKTISTLRKIGIEVKAIITDQDSNFDTFAKNVKGVTVENPYFFVEGHKVYYIFDVPRLLCDVRDALVATDFEYEGHFISWNFINLLYESDSAMGLRLVPKLTVAHLNPSGRPQVELAAQVFSRTVSIALDTHVAFKTVAKEANTTSRFVESMDNLFDVLNSTKVVSDKLLQLPFKDMEEQRYVLTEAFKMFSVLRVIPKDDKEFDVGPIYETFQNFQITIQSVLQLYRELSDLFLEQLCTRTLNKSNLDVLFDSLATPASVQPTPVEFSRGFSKMFMSSMLEKTPRKRVDLLSDACSVLSQAYSAEKRVVTLSSVLLNPKRDYQMELPAEDPLTYIASYLLYKSFEEHRCGCLKHVMRKCRRLQLTLNRKSPFFRKLKLPPSAFVEYIAKLEAAFVANCTSLTTERPGRTMFNALKTLPAQSLMMCPCFPLDYCIKLFVRLRIFATLKYNQRKIKEGVMSISVERL